MRMKQTTAPAVEPVSTTEAKLHCRIDGTAEDTLIAMLIQAARELAENETNRALITQAWTAYLDAFPKVGYLYLPKPPLGVVNSVKYYDYDGVLQTMPSTSYDVGMTGTTPAKLCLAQNAYWPTSIRQRPDAVRIEFTCGYGAAGSAVPASIRAAMLLLIGHWYENREAVVTGTIATEIPQSAQRLLWSYKCVEAPGYSLLTDAE
jgi:uncharacterized phiE125 gp8 family phage protein